MTEKKTKAIWVTDRTWSRMHRVKARQTKADFVPFDEAINNWLDVVEREDHLGEES